jgi:hypothetical protein
MSLFPRRYFSMHNPEAEAQYTCMILHGEAVDGGTGPRCAPQILRKWHIITFFTSIYRFRIIASDDLNNPITAGTATGAWSVIVKAANKIRNRYNPRSYEQ